MQVANETRRYQDGLKLHELDEGLLVRQGGDDDVARDW